MAPAARTRYTAEVIEETDFIVPTAMVHEAGAANLQPPVLRWPQLPQEPESQPVEEGVSYLEILINEGGTVDKVRLRATRINFHERMLVSAAKAWVFHPARIDGRAVRYLMRVPILAQ
jgi:outer membrane biosynthesis protein TonB